MKVAMRFVALVSLVGLFIFVQTPVAASTHTPEEFFKGKTIRIIVGTAPGGGFDVTARLLARHLPRHIPGSPRIIIQNMPGGGQLIAANYGYNRAKPDGLTWINFHGSQVLASILGLQGREFDIEKYEPLGVPMGSWNACIVMTRTGITSTKEFLRPKEPLHFGASGAGTAGHFLPTMLREALDANHRVVTGYPGTADVRRAMATGDIDAGCWDWVSIKVTAAEMLEKREAIPMLQMGLKRHRELPDCRKFA